MGIFKEFKEFISRGNVMDMAVGVVMGGAFQKIITSLVENIITPFIGVATGKVNIAELACQITEELVIPYGKFLQSIIDFLIIAVAIFAAVKTVNTMQKKLAKKEEEKPQEPPKPSNEEVLLTEIRDLLKNK